MTKMKLEFSKSDIKLLQWLYAGALLFCFFLFLYVYLKQGLSGWELYYKYKSELIHNGIVTKKYIDKKNRSTPTILLNDNSKVILISNTWFDYFEIGDSVYKEKGSLIVRLIKKNTQDTLYFDYRDIEK